jgi:hypothetical protein
MGAGILRLVRQLKQFRFIVAVGLCLSVFVRMDAQDATDSENHAGYVPVLSGGAGYVQNVNGGVTALEPQINPVLLFPFGSHVLLESRAEFIGVYQRENLTTGPFTGKVYKNVDYAQLDWLANTHVMAVAGKYLVPFGLFNERLSPFWIRNLQDGPIDSTIGLGTSGAGDGAMLRGVALQKPAYTLQYSAYFSASSNINQLQATRAAGGDASIYLLHPRLEIGSSYQRTLQAREINSVAAYVSWQPPAVPIDLKAEYDYSYYGNGYWLETAYDFEKLQIPSFLRRFQAVGRMQQFFPLNGGGNELPRVNTQRFDFGLNYYFRDDLRIVSSYGRSFSSQQDKNIWNVGLTYRFVLPLWPERKK